MSHRFIDAHRLEYPVREMCAALGVSSSGYYARAAREPCARQLAAETLLAAIKAIHAEHRAYGSPRNHAQLLAQGHQASLGTIEKLMRDNDIFAINRPKFRVTTTDSKHDFPIADNLLDRNFRTNEKWLADITYIPSGEGWLYLAAVMDLCTRKIADCLSWSGVLTRCCLPHKNVSIRIYSDRILPLALSLSSATMTVE